MKLELELNEQEIFESYIQYIDKLSVEIIKLAEYFRTDKLEFGLRGILDLSEGLTWLNLSNEYLVNKNKVKEINFIAIQSYLLEINEGLEIGDYVLVADILEYEIAPYFEQIV